MRLFPSLLLVVGSIGWVSPARGLSPQEKFFERAVRPLLIEHCHECHSDALQESELRLDSIDSILQGGISGPAAVSGHPDDSLILHAVTGQGLEMMPPDSPLEPEQIAVLRRWIRLGMPWTQMPSSNQPNAVPLGDQEAIGKVAQTHWAFQPIDDPAVPAIDSTTGTSRVHWNDHPIDAFVWTKLDEHGLRPNGTADRRTLARRLYYDLIGMPPTAEQVEAFANDGRDDAESLRSLTNELLDSPHYGERWGRYWLDVARYADTRDWQAQADLRYPYAYTFRDYVIQSLNDDKPYDQFIREQLAADFLTDDWGAPEMAALGFLTVGPMYRNNRPERVADRIDVVCRGLMGVTVACARCHDHKYDPIPIEDYYSLYGVFSNTEDLDEFPVLSHQADVDPSVRDDFDQKLAAAKRKMLAYQQKLRRDAIRDIRRKPVPYLKGFYRLSIAKNAEIRGVISKLNVLETGMTPLNQKLARELARPPKAEDPVLGPWFDALAPKPSPANAKSAKTPPAGKRRANRFAALRQSWKDNPSLNPVVRRQLEIDAPSSAEAVIESYGKVFELVFDRWRTAQAANESFESLDDPDLEALRQVWAAPGGWLDLDVKAVANASRLFGKGRKALNDLDSAIGEVESSHPGAPARAMAVRDAPKIRGQFVMLRGEPARRGDNVPKRFPAFIDGESRIPFQNGSGRRELAERIVSPSNPLTARVIVNRVWSKYFGAGLVPSLDDFGLRCDPPTHPKLLDHLATGLIQNGWSLKWLHRTITSSQVYAQSSDLRESALAVDPGNQFLWRQNRRRLDFEAMRDSMLVVAGQLDPTLGGRSVRLSEAPYSKRRSVYAYIDRNEMDPMLRTFDFASPSASAASRAETMIPQQALFTMNHPMVAEFSRNIADIVRSESSPADPASWIEPLYQQVFARSPSAAERRIALEFLNRHPPSGSAPHQLWSYGYGPMDSASDDFEPLPHWTGNSYQAGNRFPDPELKFLRLTASGGHPGADRQHAVIRRWTAPVGGTIRISGTVRHSRPNSDGIEVMIRRPGGTHRYPVIDGEAKTATPPLQVVAGDVVDFIVGPRGSSVADGHGWVAEVIGIGGPAKGKKWNSRTGFLPPPPPPLEPLAQLAQALLITNEFIFLD